MTGETDCVRDEKSMKGYRSVQDSGQEKTLYNREWNEELSGLT